MSAIATTLICCALAVAGAGGTDARAAAVAQPAATVVTERVEPAKELDAARRELAAIVSDRLEPRAALRFARLREAFARLEARVRAASQKRLTVTGAGGAGRGARYRIVQQIDWTAEVATVDRLTGELLGFPVPGEPPLIVDSVTRAALERFRTHFTRFATAPFPRNAPVERPR
jgi:hypothetical protein